MEKIKIVNLKCGGCGKSIQAALKKNGFKNIEINLKSQEVSFEGGSRKKVKKILAKLGYPEEGSAEAKKISKKAKSFLSCFTGRMKK